MPPRIVVLGGGVGGLLTANLLARRLGNRAAIRVVDATGMHVFQPGWLYVALDKANARWLARDTRALLRREIALTIDTATRIDIEAHRVELEHDGSLDFDYLVIATGTSLDREAVPGMKQATHDFYSSAGAERLREALRTFAGGDLVVSVPHMPFKCPPAPVEFTLLVEEYLRKHGIRDRSTVSYVSPLDRAFPIASVDSMVRGLMTERGVRVVSGFEVVEVDGPGRRLVSPDGRSLSFDLAVSIPPHRGAAVIMDSGLGNQQGWIPADPRTLAMRGAAGVYVVGDATDLPTSKNGSTAHFEAPRVTEQIVAGVERRAPNPLRSSYRGLVICPFEVGGGKATVLAFDYDRPPRPLRPRRVWHAATWLFNRAYWLTVRRGRL